MQWGTYICQLCVWGVCHTANRRGIGCLNCISYVIRNLRCPGMLRRVDWLFAVQTVWPLNMGPIGCPDASVIASLRCVTSQKSDDHIYTAAEARGNANNVLCPASLTSGHPKLIPSPFVYRVGRRHLHEARRLAWSACDALYCPPFRTRTCHP